MLRLTAVLPRGMALAPLMAEANHSAEAVHLRRFGPAPDGGALLRWRHRAALKSPRMASPASVQERKRQSHANCHPMPDLIATRTLDDKAGAPLAPCTGRRHA
jgi:RNA 3'-terminal phosphate cyclase